MNHTTVAYLVYLAWKIASARPPSAGGDGKRLNSLQAAMFQWVNPKAWTMALTALTVYAPGQGYGAIALVAIVCALVNTPSVFVWVVLGSNLQRLLRSDTHLRLFNVAMAMVLLATLYPVLTD